LGWTLYSNYASAPAQSVQTPSYRLLLWNVAGGNWRQEEISKVIESAKPEIVVLLETGGPPMEPYWRQLFEGWHLSRFESGIVLASAFPVLKDQRIDIGSRGRCRQATVSIGGNELNLLITDIKSNPLNIRRDTLNMLAESANKLQTQYTIVLGDFNTPRDSVWFEPLRECYREAFEQSGHGWKCTWPMPFPILDLDHVWLSRRTRPLRAEHQWTLGSDHSPVIVDFSLN
jgi:endonuclease/exonuclease/phosphatase (EEP) superfamily protein YafD